MEELICSVLRNEIFQIRSSSPDSSRMLFLGLPHSVAELGSGWWGLCGEHAQPTVWVECFEPHRDT